MTEYVIKVHVTSDDEEKVEDAMYVITHMLNSPRENDPSPDGFGMPGVQFEGMFCTELDEHGNEVSEWEDIHDG